MATRPLPATQPRIDRADSVLGAGGQFVTTGWLRANRPGLVQGLAVAQLREQRPADWARLLVPQWRPPLIDISKKWFDPNILAHLTFDVFSPTALDLGGSPSGFQHSGSVYLTPGASGTLTAKSLSPRFIVDQISVDSGKPMLVISPTGQVTTKQGSFVNYPGGAAVDVKGGLTAVIGVTFLGQPNEPAGTVTGHIQVTTPSGTTDIPVQATVLPGKLAMRLTPAHAQLVAGQSLDASLTVSTSGPATTVTLSAAQLPPGVTVQGLGPVQLAAGGKATVQVKLVCAADAPEAQGQVVRLRAQGAAEPQPAEAAMTVDTYLPIYEWAQSIDGKYVRTDYTLTIKADGSWTWDGTLHDKSTWYGDYYSLIVGLPYKDPSSGKITFHYVEVDGKLGAENSGPAVNGSFVKSGTSVNLKNNFAFAVQHGPVGHLHTEGDFWGFVEQAAKEAVDLAKKYGPEVATAMAGL